MNRRRFLKNAAGIFVPSAFGILRARGDVAWAKWNRNASTASGGISYLVNEQCESGKGSWATPSGLSTLNYAYSSPPAPLKDTKSFAGNGSGTGGIIGFSPQTSVEMFFLFSTASTSSDNFPGGLVDDALGTNNLAFAGYSGSLKTMQLFCGSKTVSTIGVLAINVTYGLYLRYVKGSGTNDFASLEFTVTPFIRLGVGSNFVSLSNGDANLPAAFCEVANFASTIVIFDDILVSASAIPSNPP